MIPWGIAVATFGGGTIWGVFLIYAVGRIGDELKGSGSHVREP